MPKKVINILKNIIERHEFGGQMVVKVYTTSSCPYCIMVKEFLKQKNVKFDEISVDKDRTAAKEMIEKSGQMGVPVIDINGTIIVGFNRPAIETALKA